MSDLMNLLFDHYNAKFPEMKQKPQAEHEKYQLLKTLAGEEQAIAIWDAAMGAGADDSDYCFTAGIKMGFALALELFTFPAP